MAFDNLRRNKTVVLAARLVAYVCAVAVFVLPFYFAMQYVHKTSEPHMIGRNNNG